MTADPPTDVELEWLRIPHPDQLDLDADPHSHLIDLDSEEPQQ